MTASTAAGPTLALPQRPTFGRHLAVHVVDGDGVALLGERTSVVLAGGLYERLAKVLDGTRTADEVADLARGRARRRRGVLRDLAASVGRSRRRRRSGGDPGCTSRRVAVMSVDGETGAWASALRGVWVRRRGRGVKLVLQLVSDYRAPALAAWNRRALIERRPWLLVRTGGRAWIGPLFQPGRGPCWECLRHRLARNEMVRSFLERRLQARAECAERCSSMDGGDADRPRERTIGASATRRQRTTTTSITIVDTVTLESQRHIVARRPQCPACGDPDLYARQVAEPFELKPAPKQFKADGGHRTVTPEATVARLESLVDPVTGVVTAFDAHHAAGLRAARVHGRHESRLSGSRPHWSSRRAAAVEQRKGVHRRPGTRERAGRSARTLFGERARRRASRALDPLRAMRERGAYRPARRHPLQRHPVRRSHQVAARQAAVHDRVPDPIDEDNVSSIGHRCGRSRSSVSSYLPTGFPLSRSSHSGTRRSTVMPTRMDARPATRARRRWFRHCACSSSETPSGIWWYNRDPPPGHRHRRFRRPRLGCDRAPSIERKGREVWLPDLTNDVLGFHRRSPSRGSPIAKKRRSSSGWAPTSTWRMAAMRAVSEMNQMFSALDVLRSGTGLNAALVSWLSDANDRQSTVFGARGGRAAPTE